MRLFIQLVIDSNTSMRFVAVSRKTKDRPRSLTPRWSPLVFFVWVDTACLHRFASLVSGQRTYSCNPSSEICFYLCHDRVHSYGTVLEVLNVSLNRYLLVDEVDQQMIELLIYQFRNAPKSPHSVAQLS